MTLDEIKAKFTGLMNRRDLAANATLVGDFIDVALMRIQRELRCPAMEKAVLITIGTPYTGLVIPGDLLELIQIIPQNTMRSIKKCSITKALQVSTVTGEDPVEYCRQGGVWVLAPSPGLDDVIRIDYYAELAPLVLGTDTNVISIIAWDLIVYCALSAAADWFTDKRAATFEGRYMQILAALTEMGDADELDTAVMEPAYIWPSDNNDYDASEFINIGLM
jgi:hypothetical protein